MAQAWVLVSGSAFRSPAVATVLHNGVKNVLFKDPGAFASVSAFMPACRTVGEQDEQVGLQHSVLPNDDPDELRCSISFDFVLTAPEQGGSPEYLAPHPRHWDSLDEPIA
mgnify:CR=1 FL=1